MACLECRRRRIRCDSGRPKCCQCTRLSKSCEYAASEQRRGPKKRSVKELEQRLATVEAQLKAPAVAGNTSSSNSSLLSISDSYLHNENIIEPNQTVWSSPAGFDLNKTSVDFPFVMDSQEWPDTSNAIITLPLDLQPSPESDKFPELSEILELNKIFFEEVYPCVPFIHHAKHDPNRLHTLDVQPPLCLRYAMWAHAATRSSKYSDRAAQFYHNARMHLEHDEMQGDGLNFATVAHVQTWTLISIIECETPVPARAYMSNRRAIALSQLLSLHQIDRHSSNMLQPPQDFVEAEERRRTFWYIYFSDRWVGTGTGQTPSIKDEEVTTLMPASEYAFREGQPETAQSLHSATSNALGQSASPMELAVVSGWILDKCTVHLRQAPDVKDDSRERQFWLRHQQLDNIISRILMTLPDHLRAGATREPLAVFVNMCLHQFIISLFQAAVKLAQKSPSRYDTVARLRLRVHRGAEEIINIMRAEAYMDVKRMCPFIPSCLYVAATVYINDLSSGYEVEHAREALLFILHTIKLFRKHWRAAQMMLAQILYNLKGCDIGSDTTSADATPLNCFSPVGEDFDALGPHFATEILLDEVNTV